MNPLGSELMTLNGAGIHITRPETAMGDAGQHNIWTVADGPILVLALWGVILNTGMSGTGSTLNIVSSLGPTNLCANLAAIANDPAGTVYYMEGIQASAMVKVDATDGAPTTTVASLTAITVIPSNICCSNSGNQIGTVEWHLVYRPLVAATTVINAAAY